MCTANDLVKVAKVIFTEFAIQRKSFQMQAQTSHQIHSNNFADR